MNTPTKCSCLNKAEKAYPVESVNSSSIKGILEIPGIRTSVTTSAFDSASKNEKKIEFLKMKMNTVHSRLLYPKSKVPWTFSLS